MALEVCLKTSWESAVAEPLVGALAALDRVEHALHEAQKAEIGGEQSSPSVEELRKAIDASHASLDLIGDSDWTPQDALHSTLAWLVEAFLSGENRKPLRCSMRRPASATSSSPQAATPAGVSVDLDHLRIRVERAERERDDSRAALVAAEAERDEARRQAHNRQVEYETCHDLHDQERERRVTLEQALRGVLTYLPDIDTRAGDPPEKVPYWDAIFGARRALATTAVDLEQEAE